MFKFYTWERHLMDKAGDGSGGGGSGGNSGNQGGQGGQGGNSGNNNNGGQSGNSGGNVTLTKEQYDAIMARLPKDPPGQGGQGGGQQDPQSLADQARKEREEAERKAAHEKRLEKSLTSTLGMPEWLKTNASLLPKNIASIVEAANKNNYASAIEKDSDIKVGIVEEFFSLQPNLDLLTASQKVVLEDFKKLTKDKKQEQAQQIYDSLFEPTFETLKKVKRAEQVSKGFADQSTGEQAYKARRLQQARKQFLGEKQ